MKLQDSINELFKTHLKVDTFYMTSDGQFFEGKQNADFHGSKLKVRGVATVNRSQATIEAPEPVKVPALDLAHPESSPPTEEEKAAKILADKEAQDALNEKLGSVATTSVDLPGSAVQLDNVPVAGTEASEGDESITASTDTSKAAEAAAADAATEGTIAADGDQAAATKPAKK
jgi:hypothetical protein